MPSALSRVLLGPKGSKGHSDLSLLLGTALLPPQRAGVLKGATSGRFRITTYF